MTKFLKLFLSSCSILGQIWLESKTTVTKKEADKEKKFENYYDFSMNADRIKPHQVISFNYFVLYLTERHCSERKNSIALEESKSWKLWRINLLYLVYCSVPVSHNKIFTWDVDTLEKVI